MKYNPFDGTLDRVIEDLLEQNKMLKQELEAATIELERMDDRGGWNSPADETEEDPFVELVVTNVINVDYEQGELFYEKQSTRFYIRESAILTQELFDEEDFDLEENKSDKSVLAVASPVIKTVFAVPQECEAEG